MQFDLPQALEVLTATPSVIDALLRHKSPAWLVCRRDRDAFTPMDVVAHLILADITDWMPRIRVILAQQGDSQLPPFDRFAFQSILDGKSVEQLVDEFALQRAAAIGNLTELHLTSSQLNLTGTHPEFGKVTLSQLLATWVVHDLGHIQQIVKTMANEYHEAVGPWQAYLGILH
jgi:hypothetical protein